ncbi:golgin-84 [Metopolophium dirhodum]|uniref:golgin-84 n=1 Tax=Metopolophium dirhodum TaxID=44670 RepID=UPI00298F84F8|nr:golgin-84 [Metopolophium dirhodum]XP_060868965.1 golgin-84 [Metopolophium dirhodum]XP_060868966.1 golgin-84 [Metopolophium dirhodum]
MSWLIDLAGKAEHYLDKIDQNTAVVLQHQKEKPLKDVFKTPVSENVSIEIENKPITSVPSSPATKSLIKKPKSDSRISDEHLLQYLNSHDSTIQSQYEGQSTTYIDNSIDPISKPLTEENHMLKSEIRTLNNEMSLLQYKLKTADKDINQISMELEVNKRHSANLEKELQEAHIQLRNAQDVMFRLKEKSKTRDSVTGENNLVSDNNLVHENQILQNEISTLLKRIEVDELKINDLTSEKLNLEMALNNIQFENKNTVKKEILTNLSSECNTMTAFTKTNLNNVALKLKECLNDLEIVNIQATADQGTVSTSELERSDILTKLNAMKSNLLSIDCGLQKSLHDLSGFKERLANIDLESFTDDSCNNHADITNGQGVMNEQMLSLKKAVACKQADLEQVLAENNSMAIRIESLETRLKKETNVIINVNDTDDAKAKVPHFMLEKAFDTSVARGVKRAYTSLDSFGLRTGMYLRRYPLLRTILFVYVVILHLWVMLILFSYTPETN